jgi:SAM-dependent methyltransferase
MDRGQFTADRLPKAQIEDLKRREQEGRDRGARTYEEHLERYRGRFRLRVEAEVLIQFVAPKPTDCVLDAGSGVGLFLLQVAPKVARLVCADLSAGALAELERSAAAKGIANVEVLRADLCELPTSIGPFDTVYSTGVFTQIPSATERLKALRRLYEVTKPEGRCVITCSVWNARSRREEAEKEGRWGSSERWLYRYLFSPRELGAFVEMGGFRRVKIYGVGILPGRLVWHAPLRLAVGETWLSRLPFSGHFAQSLLAVGYR